MQRFGNGHDREMLLACFPFSKPQKIAGAWYVGFETNAFVEDQEAKAGEPPEDGKLASLVYASDLPHDGRLRALQVQLIGRRSECPMGYPDRIIVVDRMISRAVRSVSD
jgi:hypothetical protein